MFSRMSVAALLLLTALPAAAQDAPPDSAAPAQATPSPASPVPASQAPVPASGAPQAAPDTASQVPAAPAAGYTEDTPVERIAADPAAKAVLNKDIPGLLDDIRYPMFKSMSLKQMQEASGGDLSEEAVDKTVTDLQALFPH